MSATVIEVDQLTHRYGSRTIYEGLKFSIPEGKIFGLLGKNGVGKTTLIKLLMGFLRPFSGSCRIFGEDSHSLSPQTRTRIGLLFEGHLAYEFMTIAQIERFYAPFYKKWNKDAYYDLIGKLHLPHNHKIANMSCGQRSQVVLGLIMAQQPDLLILDDYSMGLDAGYRRLFLDYMNEYLLQTKRTVFLTSHVIQDMEDFVDEVLFLERGGHLFTTSLKKFKKDFRCYKVTTENHSQPIVATGVIKNVEQHSTYHELFSFSDQKAIELELEKQGVRVHSFLPVDMNLEDAFIGYTGRY